ncbi:MAG: FapA family protein [Moorella sp. (in: firmicutes)]
MAVEGIRVEGETVEEAVQKAAELLGILPGEVTVEVIDAGSQGILGFGRRRAVILARPMVVEGPPSEGEVRGGEGTSGICEDADSRGVDIEQPAHAWIEDGRLYIKGNEPPATIICGAHFDMYINGKRAEGEVAAREGDILTITPREEVKKGEWHLAVTNDKLTATVTVRPGYRRTWRLRDQPPSARLELIGEPEEIPIPAVSREELLTELERLQVVFGIDEEGVHQATTTTEEMQIVIARGQPPLPPEDGRVEFLFNPNETVRREVNDEERVDYRELVVRASVSPGDLLAVKVPPRPGRPGVDVHGKEVPPPEPKDVELLNGRGTEVVEGLRCIAKAEGRPIFTQRKGKVIIDIVPVLVHRGDVDLASGNLKFKGSIEITGNVCETMTVIASQDINIGGDVTQAKVKAGGSIVINRSCIGSVITAGGVKSVYQSAEPLLSELAEELSRLEAAAAQVEAEAKDKGRLLAMNTGYLIAVLVENKFKKLPSLMARLIELIRCSEGEEVERELVQLVGELNRFFGSPAAMQSLNRDKLAGLAYTVEEMAAYCRQLPHEGGNVTLNYALNSQIRASGWVKVSGRGCFNTEITAGDRVEVQGVFRGGSIYAGGNVFIKEMGSSGGAKTLVRVAEGRLIKAAKVWPNCTLQIGKRQRLIDNDAEKVMAYLNDKGDIILGVF